jgi:DNA repair protein RecO (recombination protein O)
MAKPRVYKTEAIVLKRTNLGEADSIITLYTPNLGKIRAVAKGARRPKSKIGGHLDLLTQSALLLAQGQNLDIITQSQISASFPLIRRDLWRTSCAIYIAELVDQFTPEHVENYPVYKLLQTTLLRLCEARNNELVLRYFELHLIGHLGFQPELYQCIACKSTLAQEKNFFSASGGGMVCPKCTRKESLVRPVSVEALKVMRFFLTTDHISASRLRISPDLSLELEQLMREYMCYLLEREVKSAGFLDRIRGEADPTALNADRSSYFSRSTT